ncbi:MAG: LptF/LptG family permease [Candidatus Eisenbacteria bacterium]|nr:LptF/LptG family permease [Candidatus Eisenbacteria bacterium]
MRLLRSYILRQHLVPLLLGFGVVTFILEMDVLFDYLDLVVNRGVAPGVVLQLFVLSLGYIVALSVPCSVLVAVLMTFGRLSQDNEINALRASGVNLASVLIGPLAAAVALAAALTLFNNHVLPESNHAFANLLIDIGRMRPTVKLQEGVFVTDFPGYNLLVQSVNGRTNEMRGVTIYQLNAGGPPTTILAKRGYLSYTPDGRTAVLELKDGEIHEIPAEEGGSRRYRRLVFKTHVIHIAGAGGVLERTVRDSRSDREMSARDLIHERDRVLEQYRMSARLHAERLQIFGLTRRALAELEAGPVPWRERIAGLWGALAGREDPLERLAREKPAVRTELELWRLERDALRRRAAGLSVEIQKKFSLPAACVVFVLIGAPLGMRVRRAGPAVAFVSVAFFLFYYLCLVGGEELANRLLLPPWLAMWLPNIVLGLWGLAVTLRTTELWLPRARSARSAGPREGLRSAA